MSPTRDELLAYATARATAEHDLTLLDRLAMSLGVRVKEPGQGQDAPHADQALIVRPIGDRVSVAMVSADKLASMGALENEIVLDENSDGDFEKEFAQAVFEEEVLKQSHLGTIKDLIENWLASARNDRTYIAQVLEKHRETHAHAAEVIRRAREVRARYER